MEKIKSINESQNKNSNVNGAQREALFMYGRTEVSYLKL